MKLRKCTCCGIEKNIEDFSKRDKIKIRSKCKDCTRAKIREHYQNNKQYYIDKALKHNKKYIAQNKQFVWDYLKNNPCVDCKESDPIVLEFDHLKEKYSDISSMVSQSYCLETIRKEIEKCQVRCANCHRRKTAEQFSWYKGVVK